jgi:hypothetical protein
VFGLETRPPVRHRVHVRLWALLLVVSAALAVVAVVFAVRGPPWKTVRANGIVARIPAGWSAMKHGPWCMRGGGGLLMANVLRRWRHKTVPDGCTTAWAFQDIPSSFRAVDIEHFAFPDNLRTNTKLPLALPARRFGADPARGSLVVWHGAEGYVVSVAWGVNIRRRDRVLASVLGSVRFAR